MLRDVMAGWRGIVTWPCDEINLVWRHGNVAEPTDVLTRDQASASTRHYIRTCFSRLASKHQADFVLEKTCANSLRVGFVDEILPEARFIFIVRNGIDAALSAAKRWHAPLDIPYTLRKLRYVPIGDVPHYSLQFVKNRFAKLTSRQSRLASWGPRFPGMAEAIASRPIEEVCALQWKHCVEHAERDLAGLAPARVFRLRYEDFVGEPDEHLARIGVFLGLTGRDLPNTSAIRTDLVGRGRRESDAATEKRLRKILADTLQRYAYD